LLIGVGSAVLFRLTLVMSTPSLSDDIYRYVWDGRVAGSGVNPYQYPPAAPELADLREDEIYPRINHKEIPTIYPPVMQFLFQAIYQIHPSLLAFKAGMVGFDLLTMALLFSILQGLDIDARRGLIYAWNPLVIVEFAGSGHADIIGIFFLALSLWLLFGHKTQLANVALALSFLSKFFTAMLWPIYFIMKNEKKKLLALSFFLVALVLYLPYIDAGPRLFAGLLVYTEKWQSNASAFALIFSPVRSWLPESLVVHLMILPYGYTADPTTLDTRTTDLALHISKAIVTVIFAGIFSYFFKRLKNDVQREGEVWIAKLGLIVMGSFFLLGPTLQPWYLCWLLPFLVIAPNRAWLLLSGLIAVSYWTLLEYDRTGIWQESWWVKALEYAPFYLVLIHDYLKSGRRSDHTGQQSRNQT